ncbi:MAG TPA: hypothetical protein VFT59_04400 [Candidatus Saccharimonadales bacterium]|nr:hypothetical protein [Candidatus Saccharimonadales bacterium]
MTGDTTSMVELRTGESVALVTVETFRMTLEVLYRDVYHPMAFLELVLACRDRSHVLFGQAGQFLKEAGLVSAIDENGCADIHDDVRRVVLAMVEGDGAEMRLVSPYATSLHS